MRRRIGWLGALVVAGGLVGLGTVGAVGAQAATVSAPSSTCTGTVHISSLRFAPTGVPAGQSSTATLKARNCTGKTQKTTTYWFGHFSTATGTGVPAGCPVIDPLPRPLTFAPHGSGTLETSYRVPPTCTGTKLTITVRIVSSTGTVLATKDATLTITH